MIAVLGLFAISLAAVVFAAGFFYVFKPIAPERLDTVAGTPRRDTPIFSTSPQTTPAVSKQSFNSASIIVPFTAQAPTGNWDDPLYQSGCEEASVLMAMSWVQGRTTNFTPQEALQEIKKLADFQLENYGHFHDRSAMDTAELIKDYFDHQGVEVKDDITAEDIKTALSEGNIVIVPADGRKLSNPYYVPPGPLEHMLVIKGYDAATQQFITNDPGTKRGENFRYADHVLLAAIRDYPTGYHEPITEEKKVMIVVKPQSA